MINPEEVGQKYFTYAKWAAVAVFCYLSYGVAFMALQGAVAWIGFGLLAYVSYNTAPLVATLVANWKIAALKAIIEANPIETMHNLFIAKTADLNRAGDNIVSFEEEIGNFKSKVTQLKQKYPGEAQEYITLQTKMEDCLKVMKDEQKYATQQLNRFKDQIDKAEFLYDMAKSANKMLESSKSAQAQVYAEIKEKISFEKVNKDLNRAFANMNRAIEKRKDSSMFSPEADQGALPPMQVEVVDITDRVPSGQKVRVQ